ncbi:hypothetical protein D3C77_353990 [compost metagenome]
MFSPFEQLVGHCSIETAIYILRAGMQYFVKLRQNVFVDDPHGDEIKADAEQ